jgi:hypothetical protein
VAETSFPAADGSGVTDAAYERLMGPVIGSGRVGFDPTSSMVTTPLIFADSSGRQVKAYANQSAIVRGFRWESGTTPPVVALDANTSGNPRLDLIVLRLNRSTYQVRLTKITGTPAASPVAPSPIQDTGTTGSWDLPLARARVTSSGTTGQPLIAAADITAVDYWIAPPGLIAPSGRVYSVPDGLMVLQPDSKRLYYGVGGALALVGDPGERFSVASTSAFTNANIVVQRMNGLVWFQAVVSLNITARAPGADTLVCALPIAYRPAGDVSFTAFMTPGQIGQGTIAASDGAVTLLNYPETFPNGGLLSISPMTWPSA